MDCAQARWPRPRVWLKVPLGIDEQSLKIRAVEAASNDTGDAPMLPGLLSKIPLDPEFAPDALANPTASFVDGRGAFGHC
jgi:hypothetical protein